MSCLCKYRESLSKSGGVCVLRGGSVSVLGLSFPTKANHTGERSLGKGNRKLSWQGRSGSGPCLENKSSSGHSALKGLHAPKVSALRGPILRQLFDLPVSRDGSAYFSVLL